MRVPNNLPKQPQLTAQAGASVRQEFGATIQEVRSETNVQAAEAEAMVKARCIMARSNPRSIDVVRQKVLADCKRPLFADKAIFSKPVGKNEEIEGPSVRFAEALSRHMGNMDVGATVAEDTPERRRIRVTAMDLETNTTTSADVVIRKVIERKSAKDREVLGQRQNTYGDMVYLLIPTEDELLNMTNAAVSKMRRNKIIELVPADIVEEAMALCNATLAQADAQDPDAARKKIADAFLALGIPAKDLVAYVGHSLDVLTPAEIHTLRRVHNSIRDGESTWAAAVEAKAASAGQATKAPPKANSKAPAAAAKPAEEEDVDPPHNPKTGEVLEPTAEDVAAAAAREALRKAHDAAQAAEAKPAAPATQTVQGQLGIDFSTPDATDQVKARMQAVVDDPAGTVEQLMKVARMAEHCPKERQQELGKFTVQCRTIINGRKKA